MEADKEPALLASYQVMGREQFNGRETTVVQRRILVRERSALKRSTVADDVSFVWVDKAWIDPARGFLPIRLERWRVATMSDPLSPPENSTPEFTLETKQIVRYAGDAFYPTETEFRREVFDDHDPSNGAGKTPTTQGRVPSSQLLISCKVDQLTINPEMTDAMFNLEFPANARIEVLEFPRGVTYFDDHYNRFVLDGRPADPLWYQYIDNWVTAVDVLATPLWEMAEEMSEPRSFR